MKREQDAVRPGVPRRIVGYHQDEKLDWVAELECGHQQHLRHNPPWTVREWVISEEGRAAHIGWELFCSECEGERNNRFLGQKARSE